MTIGDIINSINQKGGLQPTGDHLSDTLKYVDIAKDIFEEILPILVEGYKLFNSISHKLYEEFSYKENLEKKYYLDFTKNAKKLKYKSDDSTIATISLLFTEVIDFFQQIGSIIERAFIATGVIENKRLQNSESFKILKKNINNLDSSTLKNIEQEIRDSLEYANVIKNSDPDKIEALKNINNIYFKTKILGNFLLSNMEQKQKFNDCCKDVFQNLLAVDVGNKKSFDSLNVDSGNIFSGEFKYLENIKVNNIGDGYKTLSEYIIDNLKPFNSSNIYANQDCLKKINQAIAAVKISEEEKLFINKLEKDKDSLLETEEYSPHSSDLNRELLDRISDYKADKLKEMKTKAAFVDIGSIHKSMTYEEVFSDDSDLYNEDISKLVVMNHKNPENNFVSEYLDEQSDSHNNSIKAHKEQFVSKNKF